MLHKGIEIRSAHSRISLAEILSRPVALDLDNRILQGFHSQLRSDRSALI